MGNARGYFTCLVLDLLVLVEQGLEVDTLNGIKCIIWFCEWTFYYFSLIFMVHKSF